MTATPAPAGLDELDALLAAATPGEWAVPHPYTKLVDVPGRESAIQTDSPADAALIVALRNRAPAMVAAIRAAYALAEEMEQAGQLPDTHGEFDRGVGAHQRDAAANLRAALDEALGASGE